MRNSSCALSFIYLSSTYSAMKVGHNVYVGVICVHCNCCVYSFVVVCEASEFHWGGQCITISD